MADNTVEIGAVQKNDKISTRVRITEFKGKHYVDIRDWFKPQQGNTWQPTKKGTSVPVDKLSAVMDLLEKAEKHLKGGESVQNSAVPV